MSVPVTDMRDVDLHQWFSSDELERCPECGESAGIRLPDSGSFLCLGCGHVRGMKTEDGAGETQADRS
jgi:hypothetical protein